MGFNRKYGFAALVAFIMLVLFASDNLLCADESSIKQTEIKIIINETSLVKRDHILLGDIADIHANDFLKEAFANIDLGTSPKPGKIKSFDKRKVLQSIESKKYLPKEINISSPERIYVKRLGQVLSKEDIRSFIDQHLAQLFKGKEHEILSLNIRGLEAYPQGELLLQLTKDEITDRNGRISTFLEVNINGQKEDKLSISGQIAVFENVLCVNNSFLKGQALARTDVTPRKRNIFDLSDDFIKNFEEVGKKVLKSSLKKGEYLKAGVFEESPLVKKGDIIRLLSKKENLMIMTSGISKEDGFANKLIRVENLNSGRIVRGIVKGKSTVEVVY